MVETKFLIEEARKMRRENLPFDNPYPRNFIKIRSEKGKLYQRDKEIYFYGLEKGTLEGKIEVREDEYIFRGNLFNNALEGSQTIFRMEKGEETFLFSFDVFKGVIKDTKRREQLEEAEKEKKIEK